MMLMWQKQEQCEAVSLKYFIETLHVSCSPPSSRHLGGQWSFYKSNLLLFSGRNPLQCNESHCIELFWVESSAVDNCEAYIGHVLFCPFWVKVSKCKSWSEEAKRPHSGAQKGWLANMWDFCRERLVKSMSWDLETLDLTNVLSFGEFTFFEIAAQ